MIDERIFLKNFGTLATSLHLPNVTLSDADNLLTLRIDLFSSCPPLHRPPEIPIVAMAASIASGAPTQFS